MYLIQAFPISANSSPKPLTYFHKESLPKGALVEVDLRGKPVKAIVASSSPAKDAKVLIKRSEFSLKKINKVLSESFFSNDLLKAFSLTSNFFASPFGSVVSVLVPAPVLENASLFKAPGSLSRASAQGKRRVQAIMGSKEFRLSYYLKAVTEELGRRSSVLFLCPTVKDVEEVSKEILDAGFDPNLVSKIHSGLSKKNLLAQWKKATVSPEAVLICGTYQALSIPRGDIGLVIVEGENSSSYRSLRRPYLDARVAAKVFAEAGDKSLIMGDEVLSADTFKEFEESLEVEDVIGGSTEFLLADLSSGGEKKDFSLMSKEALDLIRSGVNKKIFVLASRKGIARATVCNDCGEAVACERCGLPLNLLRDGKGTYFQCNNCGERSSAKRTCKKCSSWNLVPLGSGIEKVEDELGRLLPDTTIFRLDAGTAKTETAALVIALKWDENGGVLLGTSKALPYLSRHQASIIVSFDAMLAGPNIDSRSQTFKVLKELSRQAEKVLVQSRHGDYDILKRLEETPSDFLSDDLDSREKYGYPPFKVFIKLTAPEKEKESLKKSLSKILSAEENFYEYFGVAKGGAKALNILIKIDKEKWPHKPLVQFLKNLPPYIKVEIDPETFV